MVVSNIYDPASPWRFSKNAKPELRGKCPASMALTDPRAFYNLLNWARNRGMEPEENEMFGYMIWVKNRLEMIEPIMYCPYCKKDSELETATNPVQLSLFDDPLYRGSPKHIHYFSVIEDDSGISVGLQYSCCNKEDCKSKLISSIDPWKSYALIPATFRGVAECRYHKSDYRVIVETLQKVYGIYGGRITAQKAHNFLRKGTTF